MKDSAFIYTILEIINSLYDPSMNRPFRATRKVIETIDFSKNIILGKFYCLEDDQLSDKQFVIFDRMIYVSNNAFDNLSKDIYNDLPNDLSGDLFNDIFSDSNNHMKIWYENINKWCLIQYRKTDRHMIVRPVICSANTSRITLIRRFCYDMSISECTDFANLSSLTNAMESMLVLEEL